MCEKIKLQNLEEIFINSNKEITKNGYEIFFELLNNSKIINKISINNN